MKPSTMALAAAGVVVVAAVAGWFRPVSLETGATNPHSGAWQLPAASALERSSASQFAAIRGVAWVGEGSGSAGSPSAQWTLLGLVGRFDDRAVLVRAGNDPLIKRLRSGDTLPDGSRLVSVGSDGIVIDREGCRMRRPLYPATVDSQSPPAPGDACPPSGD
jgi:hypothetical protein